MAETPISPGLIARVTSAARFVISGVAPDAWFGPLQPMAPMAPPEVAGRRFDYPTGYNLTYTPRSSEPVSFEDLRALADSCDVLRSVIETRKDQIEALDWTVRVKANETSARVPVVSDDQKRRIDLVTGFLQCPDKEHGFDQWLRLILEDMFVIDGVAIYKRRNQAGGLYALEVIDAATIKLLLDDSGRLPIAPDPAYQQILKGIPAADYTREELMYLVHNPRSHKVYGYGHVEQVLLTVNILVRRSLHQLEYYREGSVPDALVGLPREWSSEQVSDFQKYFDSLMSGNLAARRQMRFMPGEFHYQETKAPPMKDAYDEYLARVICFVFSISPEPFVGQVNRATAQTSHSRAVNEGLSPLMRFVRSFMNRIIASEFASPDLEFFWQDAREQDPADAAKIDVAYVGAGILTADEVRANMGLAPLPASAKPPVIAAKKKFHRRRPESLAALRKAADDEGDDNSDNEDNSGFDSDHPRWPAGSPGGIGGEFAPKDSGDATATLHDAISQDAGNTVLLNPDSVWAALTSGLDGPSRLGSGIEVAGARDEVIAETQARMSENGEKLSDDQAAKETESDGPPETVTGAIESIGNAIAAGPYINSDGTLLNAQNATIDPNKIVGYSLNPNNDKGSSKAIVFNSALGYNQSNADSLIQQLQQGVQQYSATVKGVDSYGARFTVDIPVTGPNNNTATVRTGWIYDPGSTNPRLVTALVKK